MSPFIKGKKRNDHNIYRRRIRDGFAEGFAYTPPVLDQSAVARKSNALNFASFEI
jgi:hypothetical protein